MTETVERTVEVWGTPCRVWEKGQGETLGFLAGFGGMPRWAAVLDRLAERRRVVVPSLPGFPGAGKLHMQLDDIADWVSATLDLLEGAGLCGTDLVGASFGGVLAAEVAAFCPQAVGKLVLIASHGLYDTSDPVQNVFEGVAAMIPGRVCSKPERYAEHIAALDGQDPLDARVEEVRANEAAARLLWPFGDHGLVKRLHRIRASTLLLWGSDDQVVPPSYSQRFAAGIAGPTVRRTISGAGHIAYLDDPDAVADALIAFLDG